MLQPQGDDYVTQCETVLKHLKQRPGRIITTYQAYDLYKITRLADRCRDLRAKGHRIHSAMCKLPSGKRVAVYSLA
jgi:Helix-turn-helix domain